MITHKIAPYRLRGMFDREGVLLQVTYPDGKIGYADCHPWSERGDLPLKEQLHALRNGTDTPLLTRSLHYAKLDAEARAIKKNLFEDLVIPKSHCLLSGDELEPGYTHYKIKGSDPQRFCHLAKQDPRALFRLDFNSQGSAETVANFLHQVEPFRHQIDFIEDPFPFSHQWESFRQKHHITLALDLNIKNKALFQGPLVIKPAVEDPEEFSGPLVITSYLDHPLGQLSAAHSAAKRKTTTVCGLLSHHVYEKNLFSEQLSQVETRLVPPEGIGFGFDQLLKEQPWISL